MIFDFIKHCETIVFTVNKFNFFLKNLNFNKNFEIINNVNLISSDMDSNNYFNIMVFYDLDLGKLIKKGFDGKIYNYNGHIVKCNIEPIQNLNTLKEIYINRLLYDNCKDNTIKIKAIYYLIKENLICSVYEKADYDLKYYIDNIFIKENKDNIFGLKMKIIKEIDNCYKCLKKSKIIHQEINPNNLVIFKNKEDFKIKLIDFGKSKFNYILDNRSYTFNIINKILNYINEYRENREFFNLKLLVLFNWDFFNLRVNNN